MFDGELPRLEKASPLDRLDDKAKKTLAELALTANAADALDGIVHNPLDDVHIDPEKRDRWTRTEINRRLRKWRSYPQKMIGAVPPTFEDFAAGHQSFEETAHRLYATRELLRADRLTTVVDHSGPWPTEEAFSDGMKLQLMPWQTLKHNMPFMIWWFHEMLHYQKWWKGDHYVARSLSEHLRQPDTYLDSAAQTSYSFGDYLDMKLEQEGPWGMMLVNTGQAPTPINNPERDEQDALLAQDPYASLTYRGINIDAMGVFEWMAMNLQTHPQHIARQDRSELLANRIAGSLDKASILSAITEDGSGSRVGFAANYMDNMNPVAYGRWTIA